MNLKSRLQIFLMYRFFVGFQYVLTLLLDTDNNEQGNGVLHNQQIYAQRFSVILEIYGFH